MRLNLLCIFFFFPLFVFPQSGWNMNLLGSFDYETNHNTKCNDIWGWEDGNGNEYALVGLESGFSCVDVTNPSSPTEMFFISDITSIWRDIKSWGNYAYITTEAISGLLIVDLTDMTGNTFWHVSNFVSPSGLDTVEFTSAHNIYIDENGIAYIFGARNNGVSVANRGAIFLDVNANATSPEYLGEWTGEYIHDGMARGDTMYAGCIYAGELFVVDVSNKSNPQTIGQHTTPNNFTHNAWVSDDGNYVFTTDEQSNAYLTAYDISNINNIQEVDRIQSNPGSNSIPHNTHVDGNFLITSYYRDGTTVHDITYPNHMIQVAYYDSYIGSGNGFNGCWGTYPFLSSGNIISSDRDSYNGKGVLNIYGRAFQQACYLMGNVIDGINGNNIASVDVAILSTTTSAQTNLVGDYQTAVIDSGIYQIVFSKSGYISDTSSILLDNGIMTILDAQLYPIGSGQLTCENFESYSPGSYLAATSPNWITWTQPYTASEDIQVTNTLSNSGTNSIFFNGTSSSGGPSDVVLPFSLSTPYTNGFFNFRSNFYVMNGAYFNFQAETTAGITWALDVGMNNGTINFGTYPGFWTAVYLSSTYPTNQWFELKIEIDLNSNSWEVFIDGVSQGSFANPTNQIASLDLYPLSGHQFYVDDICYEYSTTPIGIYGCTDSTAINYNPSATVDDGSCI